MQFRWPRPTDPTSPRIPVSPSSPLEFLTFTECMSNPCEGIVDAIAVENTRNSKPVTRTFQWRPEEFPMEDGTYMQCEEPWESATPPARLRAAGVFKAGRAGPPLRIMQRHMDDDVDDMLDDEESAALGNEGEAGVPRGSDNLPDMQQPKLIDLDPSNATLEGFQSDPVIAATGSSAGLPPSVVVGNTPLVSDSASEQRSCIEPVEAAPAWNADWMVLPEKLPPAPASDSVGLRFAGL